MFSVKGFIVLALKNQIQFKFCVWNGQGSFLHMVKNLFLHYLLKKLSLSQRVTLTLLSKIKKKF